MDQSFQVQSKEISIAIKRIKVLSFAINETAIKQDSALLKADIEQNLGFAIDKDLVEFKIRVYYHYHEEIPIVADITVQNIFEIPNLVQYLAKDTFIILPEKAIITIVGESLSHTRALLSQYLLGTSLQASIMSIINPVDVAKHYFPYMFSSAALTEEKRTSAQVD